MSNIDYEKYIKYKNKYLQVKNQYGGGARDKNIEKQIKLLRDDPNLIITQNNNIESLLFELVIIRKSDGNKFNIKFPSNYPFGSPVVISNNFIITYDNYKWNDNISNFFTIQNTIDDSYIEIEISNYNCFEEISNSNDFFYIKKNQINGLTKDINTKLIELVNNLYFTKKTITQIEINSIVYILNSNVHGLIIKNFEFKNNIKNIKIQCYDNLTKDQMVKYLKSHSCISKISYLKPVATGITGYDLRVMTDELNKMLSDIPYFEVILSEYLTDINGYLIDLKIYKNPQNGDGTNPFLFYSKKHLDILGNLFGYNHHDVISLLQDFRPKTDKQIQFIHLAFNDDYKTQEEHQIFLEYIKLVCDDK